MRYIKFSLLAFLLFYGCSSKSLLIIKSNPPEKISTKSQAIFDVEHQFKQITTHPEIDLMPALSPDGKWIAFSSKRSGNMDVWVKPVKGGRSIQVTFHKADDLYPCWSHDGESIVFVSQREDAAGDLWRVKIDTRDDIFTIVGSPNKLTHYLGLDDSPAFSPDDKTIAFTSDRDGQRNIWLYNLHKKKLQQLTFYGGMNPTWSPDSKHIAFISFRNGTNSGGDLFIIDVPTKKKHTTNIPSADNAVCITHNSSLEALPYWSPTAEEIVFTRYSHDTNGDGKLTPDDQPSLWKIILADTTEIQLTPLGYYYYFPNWGRDDRIYFISDKSGNRDIWSIFAGGPIPRLENAFLQYQFADLYFPIPEEVSIFSSSKNAADKNFLYLRLLAFQRVSDYFPTDSIWIGFAQYELARTYDELNNTKLAKEFYVRLLKIYKHQYEIVGNVYWQLLKYDINEHRNDDNYLKDKIQYCSQLKSQFNNNKKLCAKLVLAKGELYYHIEEKLSALQVYEKLINTYPDEREYCAIAQIRIAEIYADFGQYEEVTNSFLKVIQNYPDQPSWVTIAVEQILQNVRYEDVYSTIAAYRKIIGKYPQYRRLAAHAQFKIGQLLFQQNDYQTALTELSLVKENYPEQRVEIVQSELLISEVYLKNNEDLRAINNLKTIIENYGDVESGLYVVKAKQRLIEIYLSTGRRLRNLGDYELALNRYRGAIKIQSRNLEAHRGLIFCLARLGRIDEGIKIYNQALSRSPDDEVILYTLGLCYSYKATEESERKKTIEALNYSLIKKSNQLIEDALAKNYRLIPAYLGLSFNYEVIEKYESYQRNKQQGFLTKFARTISAPIVSVFRFLTFQKPKLPERWYERAIDALTTAITLNDEKEDPTLESELALNLAHNYYNLEEFGYEKAYYYYHIKLKYDTTFVDLKTKAEVYKRIGHCALVTEDFNQGSIYLKRAIKFYQDLGNNRQVLLNIKRLALLYQMAGENDESIEYFRKAAEIELKQKRWSEVEKIYRSIAYNYQLLNDEEEALRYAKAAVYLLKSGRIKQIQAKPNWIKIGILGVEFPVWNLGPIGAGESTAIEGFTTAEETALVYSIMADAYLQQKNFPKAIEYYEKKLDIYRQRKDKIAEAIFLSNIGYLYYRSENYIKAWDYFEMSLRICKEENLIAGSLFNIINLGGLGVLFSKMDLDYFERCLNHLNYGLKLYVDEVLGFQREQVQIYILLGNLYFLHNVIQPGSTAKSLDYHVIKFAKKLENFAEAENNYHKALELAQKHNYLFEQVIINQNLGQLYFSVYEAEQTFIYLDKARIIAIENNFTDLLWRSDFAIANFLSILKGNQQINLKINNDAGFYFKEAIAILEESATRKQNFNPTRFYFKEVRSLYERAIRYFINTQPDYALMLSERMRAKQYLDYFSSHKVELKKERHKNYLGLARDDNRRIAELDEKIRIANHSPKIKEKQINIWLMQKQKYLEDYTKLLKEMNEEDPELESMVHVNPVPLADLQQILSHNTVIIDYLMSYDSTYAWVIDERHIKLQALPIGKELIEKKVNSFLNRIRDRSSNKEVVTISHDLYEILFSNFTQLLTRYQNIIIIPDGELYFVPFNSLMKKFSNSGLTSQSVMIALSLSSYYYSFQKRKVMGDKIILLGNDRLNHTLQQLGYQSSTIEHQSLEKDKIKQVFEEGEILQLKASIDWRSNDPLLSQLHLAFKAEPVLEKEIYVYDLKTDLIIFNADIFQHYPGVVNFSVFNRAFFYAGTPTILYALWPVDHMAEDKFYRYFYEYLLSYPPGQALSLAQHAMIKDSTSFLNWAGYQLVGFQGMTDAEEKQFAIEQFEKRVRLGNLSFDEQDWMEAIKDYEQALIMAQKLANEEYVNNLRQLIIKAAINDGNYDKAIEYQMELLADAKYKNDVQGIAQSYANLVVFLTENKNYDQAVVYQNKYIELAKTYGLKAEVAKSYHNLGLIYEHGKNYQNAIEYYGKSRDAYQQINDNLGVATNLKDRGRVYLTNLDNYSQAIEDQLQALNLFQQEGDDENIIEVFQDLGLSYEKLAEYRTALAYQNKALKLAQQINSEKQVAMSYQYLANVRWKLGDYQTALKYQELALKQFEKLGDEKYRLIGLATQGLIRMSLGRLKQGLDSQYKALKLAEKLNDKQDQATIHKNIGLLYIADRRLDLALIEFQKAMKIDTEVDYKRGLAYDYRDLAGLYTNVNKPDTALYYLRKALVLSQEIKDSRNETQCYYELGRANNLLHKTEAALDSLKLAVNKAHYLLIPEIEWRALRVKGQIYEKNGRLNLAVENYRKAISIIEEMRSRIKVEEFKSGFIDDKLDVYSDLIMLLLHKQQPAQALEVLERARSRAFLDMLANRDIVFRGGKADDQLLIEGRTIQQEILKVQSEVRNLRSKQAQLKVTAGKKLSKLEKKLAELRNQYSNYLMKLKAENAELADMISVEPRKLSAIQSILPGYTALVEYFYTKDKIAIWTVTKEAINFAVVNQPASNLNKLVQDFRHAMAKQLSINYISKQLNDLLIAPIAEQLSNINHLTIVPYNKLHYLPFAALIDGNERYLIEKYSISLAPSATVLSFCLEKGEKYQIVKHWKRKILALGNPDLTLPFAEKEIESVKLTYSDVISYVESQATETVLKAEGTKSNIILLSCHGEFDALNPLFSALVLAADDKNDGRLEAHEIFGLDFDAYLIAMSACETGLGAIRGGDEVIGLTRSFIYAGSASLLSSLWKVDDLATAVLIKRFFRYLKDSSQTKAGALKKAQLLVKNEINNHPAFWAAFNISGDFR